MISANTTITSLPPIPLAVSTEQEALDAAWRGVQMQGAFGYNDGNCIYASSESEPQLSCAIGLCIAAPYRYRLIGATRLVDGLLHYNVIHTTISRVFLQQLQNAHDGAVNRHADFKSDLAQFHERLGDIANRFDLIAPEWSQ